MGAGAFPRHAVGDEAEAAPHFAGAGAQHPEQAPPLSSLQRAAADSHAPFSKLTHEEAAVRLQNKAIRLELEDARKRVAGPQNTGARDAANVLALREEVAGLRCQLAVLHCELDVKELARKRGGG